MRRRTAPAPPGFGSNAINQHELGLSLGRRQAEARFVMDRGAVTLADPNAVHGYHAARRHEIGVPPRTQRVIDLLAGFEPGAEHARVGADRQGVAVACLAARQRDETAAALLFRKRPRAPARTAAAPLRD